MRNESSKIESRVADGTAVGASSDRKDGASLVIEDVGDPSLLSPSVVKDSVVHNNGQHQQQHEEYENSSKPASSATKVESRGFADGTAVGASSDRKDESPFEDVGDPLSVSSAVRHSTMIAVQRGQDSVVNYRLQQQEQQQREQYENSNKPASSATKVVPRDGRRNLEGRVVADATAGAGSERKDDERYFEDINDLSSSSSFVQGSVVDIDGQQHHHHHKQHHHHQHQHQQQQQQREQYEQSCKPASSATKAAHEGRRNLIIDHGRNYKCGIGPTKSAGTPRACSSARFSIEDEIDSAVLEYEAQQHLRDNERKLVVDGLEAATSNLQQRQASPPASTRSGHRQERLNSLVNLVEGTAAGRSVPEREQLLLPDKNNGRLPAAKDNITTGNTSATTPTSSFREKHALRQDIIDLPNATDITAGSSTTTTPSSREQQYLRQDIIAFPAATDITTGITTATISSLREQHSLRQDIISLAQENERETKLLLNAEAELKGVKQAGSRGAPAGATRTYSLGHDVDNISAAGDPTRMNTLGTHNRDGSRRHHQQQHQQQQQQHQHQHQHQYQYQHQQHQHQRQSLDQDQQDLETGFSRVRQDNGVEQPVLSPTSRPAAHRASAAAGANSTRKVELVDQLVVTASSLADTVESTLLLGAPLRATTNTCQLRPGREKGTDNNAFDSSRLRVNLEKKKERGGEIQGRAEIRREFQVLGWTKNNKKEEVGWQQHAHQDTTPLLWSLLLQRCRLPSLMPVAGLLHRLNSLCSLQINGIVGRFALHGLERVLADAPCLRTIALSRCGLTKLPWLESASIETLDVSDNFIKTAAGLESLFRLKVLNMSGNSICRLMDVLPLVPLGAGCLWVLNLDGNPVQKTLRYRASVVAMVASLRMLDGTPVHRPFGASLSTEETPSRVKHRPVDGYFSDDGGVTSASRRKRQQAETARRRVGARTNLEGSGENHGFVRGLAGLGLIWGGTRRDRSSSFGSFNQLRSFGTHSYSPSAEAGAPRHSDRASLFRSNSAERLFERCKQLAGVSIITAGSSQGSSSRRDRLPSPERCRQLAGDTVRSQPRTDWNTRFRRYQEQELRVRNIAKSRTSGSSRGGPAASMERLARPSRSFHRQQSGSTDYAPPAASITSLSLTETTLGQQQHQQQQQQQQQQSSFDLVDRPTAVKGANGRWQGVVTTTTTTGKGGATQVAAAADIHEGLLQDSPEEACRLADTRDKNTSIPPGRKTDEDAVVVVTHPDDRRLDPPLSVGESAQQSPTSTSPRPILLSHARVGEGVVERTGAQSQGSVGKSVLNIPTGSLTPPKTRGEAKTRGTSRTSGTSTPLRITSHYSKLARSPVPQASRRTRTTPSQSPRRPPSPATPKASRLPTPLATQLERTTLVLSEDWELKPTSMETPSHSKKAAAQRPRARSSNRRGNNAWAPPKKQSRSPQGSKERKLSPAGGGHSAGAGNSRSYSPRSESKGLSGGGGGGVGGTRRSGGEMEMAGEKGGVRRLSPRLTRASRVLKTSRDFAQTMRRIHEVHLGEREARSLYQQLDSDHDGALGAEDLVRGASVLATFLAKRQGPSTDGKPQRRGRQGPTDALSRSATVRSTPPAWRGETLRARTPIHAFIGDDDSAPSVGGGGGGGGGGGVDSAPRRLEDWRVPDVITNPPPASLTLSARYGTDEGPHRDSLSASASGWREREPGALGATHTRDVDCTGQEGRLDQQQKQQQQQEHQYHERREGAASELQQLAEAVL